MEIDQIKELITHLEGSKLRKIVFKKGDFELHLEKEGLLALSPRRVISAESFSESGLQSESPPQRERSGGLAVEQAVGACVTSPMVGTYYATPGPDQPPFVKVGDKVVESTVVCIIEAMKVMNEVKAGVSGTVAEILADHGQPVEFGSSLLRIV